MELKEFLHILYKDVSDCYIGVPYINNGKVVTECSHSSKLDAIWLFEVPYELEGDISYICKILKGWEAFAKNKVRESHGWEFDSVADIPCKLRAPGTTILKKGEKPICEILEYNSVRYKVGHFEKYMQEVSSKRIFGHCDVTDEFAYSSVYVMGREEYKEIFAGKTYDRRQKKVYCDAIIPQRYDRIEGILGEYPDSP